MNISFFDDLGGLFLHFSHRLSLRSLGRSSEVECNPKMSISFFLAGERWQMGFESIDKPRQSSERNLKMSISFFWLERGWQMVFKSINLPGQSSEVECNPKMSISFFLSGERWQMGFESINKPGRSSEHNLKMGISLFWLERGGRQGSSPSTSPADHQKLNII